MAFFRRHKISAALLLLAHSTISCASGGTIAPDGGGVVPDGGVVLDAGLGDAGLDVAATDYEACSDFTVWAIACEGHPEGSPRARISAHPTSTPARTISLGSLVSPKQQVASRASLSTETRTRARSFSLSPNAATASMSDSRRVTTATKLGLTAAILNADRLDR